MDEKAKLRGRYSACEAAFVGEKSSEGILIVNEHFKPINLDYMLKAGRQIWRLVFLGPAQQSDHQRVSNPLNCSVKTLKIKYE